MMTARRPFFVHVIPLRENTPSRSELIQELKLALTIPDIYVVRSMLKIFPFLSDWLNGCQVTFEDNTKHSIPFDELICFLKLALSSKEFYIFEAIWKKHSLLRDWLNGKNVLVGKSSLGAPEYRNISYDELMNIFKLVLTNPPSVVSTLWQGNSFLRQWLSSQTITLGTNPQGQDDLRMISFTFLLDMFKRALESGCLEVIAAMLNGSESLQKWLAGETVYTGWNEQGQPILTTGISMSFDELVSSFKFALSTRNLNLIKYILEKNVILQQWLSGQSVKVGVKSLGQDDIRSISLKDLIKIFDLTLMSGYHDGIKLMLNGNPILKQWLRGQEIKLLIDEVPDQISTNGCIPILSNGKDFSLEQANPYSILPKERLHLFSLALQCGNMDVISVMWNDNQQLKEIIKSIGISEAKNLLKQVLDFSKIGANEFVNEYIVNLTDVKLMQEVLQDILMNKEIEAQHKTNQIKLLETRIHTVMNGLNRYFQITLPQDDLMQAQDQARLNLLSQHDLSETLENNRKRQRVNQVVDLTRESHNQSSLSKTPESFFYSKSTSLTATNCLNPQQTIVLDNTNLRKWY